MKRLFVITILFFGISFTYGSTISEEKFVCPICRNEFTSIIQMSYTTFGKNLDLKPWGAAIIPTPIPKCPQCNFVFKNEFFSLDEIAELKMYIDKQKINNIEKEYPNYYYLGEEMIVVSRSVDEIAWILLNSVWENNKRADFKYLAESTIEYLDRVSLDSEFYNTALVIKVDLQLRLNKMREAQETINIIKQNKGFYIDYIIKILEYQEVLINLNDLEEHNLP